MVASVDFSKFLSEQENDLRFSYLTACSPDGKFSQDFLDGYMQGKRVEFKKFKRNLGEFAFDLALPLINSLYAVSANKSWGRFKLVDVYVKNRLCDNALSLAWGIAVDCLGVREIKRKLRLLNNGKV